MKRWQKLVLTAAAALSLAACGNSKSDASTEGGNEDTK